MQIHQSHESGPGAVATSKGHRQSRGSEQQDVSGVHKDLDCFHDQSDFIKYTLSPPFPTVQSVHYNTGNRGASASADSSPNLPRETRGIIYIYI